MARRRRPGPRTSVVDGRAQILIPLESVVDPDGETLSFRTVSRWLHRVDSYPAAVDSADPAVAIVLDRFVWDLHIADLGHSTDTHDGDPFLDAARESGTVTIHVVRGLDPRRSKPDEIAAAARSGDVVGATVSAFPVDVVQS